MEYIALHTKASLNLVVEGLQLSGHHVTWHKLGSTWQVQYRKV